MKPVRVAVLPVAGLGTRVLPAAKTVAKELLNVLDRPIISYAVAEARAAGIEHFVMITGRGKQALEDYFDFSPELESQLEAKGRKELLEEIRAEIPKPGEMSFVRQTQPLGLGHAVWCARDIVGDAPFAVMLPDMVMVAQPATLTQAVKAHEAVGGNIIVVEPVPDSETHRYGIVALENRTGRLSRMTGMVEKPAQGTAPSNLIASGRYILQPEIFEILKTQARGAGGEIQLTDAMVALLNAGQDFHALEYEGVTYDCGDKIGLLRANVALALSHPTLGADARAAIEALLKG